MCTMVNYAEGRSKMQILTALLACIPSLSYGIQIGWLSPMAPLLQSPLTPTSTPLTDNHISCMATALSLAAVPSVPFFSYVCDRFGRKIAILSLSLLYAISWTLKLCALNPIGLICARVIAGIAASGTFIALPVYVREISQDSLRGTLGSFVILMCNTGVILVYALGMSLSYYWNQCIYLIICVLHMVLFTMAPESPGFLVKIGDDEAASKAIAWLRSLHPDDDLILKELKQLKIEEEDFKTTAELSFKSIIKDKPVFRVLRICAVLIAVQTLSGCFAVVNYAASIFERSGGEWSANSLALLVGALQLTGSLVATSTVEKCGRKILMSSSCLIISACMGAVASVFLGDFMEWSPLPRWMPVVAVCLCIFAYGAGLCPVPFIIMSEVFSFKHRAKLSGLLMMISWTNSSFVVLLFAPMANMFGEHIVFYSFAFVTLYGALFTMLCVPETRGRSLQDIQKDLVK